MKFIYYLSLFGILLCFLIGIASARRIPSYRRRRHRRQVQGDWYQSDYYKQPSAGGDNSPVGIDWLAGGGSSDTQGGSNNMPINIVGNPGGQFVQWGGGQQVPQPQPIYQGQAGGGYPAPVPNVENQPNNWLWEYQPSATLSYEDRRALEKTLADKKTKWELEESQRREGPGGNPYAPGQIDYGPTHIRPQDVQSPGGNWPMPIGPDGRPYPNPNFNGQYQHYQPNMNDPAFQPRPPDYYNGKIVPGSNSQNPYESNQQQPWDFQNPSGSNTFGGEGGAIPPSEYEYVYDSSSSGRSIRFQQEKVLQFLFCVSSSVILAMI